MASITKLEQPGKAVDHPDTAAQGVELVKAFLQLSDADRARVVEYVKGLSTKTPIRKTSN